MKPQRNPSEAQRQAELARELIRVIEREMANDPHHPSHVPVILGALAVCTAPLLADGPEAVRHWADALKEERRKVARLRGLSVEEEAEA